MIKLEERENITLQTRIFLWIAGCMVFQGGKIKDPQDPFDVFLFFSLSKTISVKYPTKYHLTIRIYTSEQRTLTSNMAAHFAKQKIEYNQSIF